MAKFRVLVVDDEKSILETRALILRTLGYEVSTSENGFDALLKLKNDVLPDLIITDLNMPQMSGFELLSVLRRRFPDILVIASSGAYDFESEIPGGLIADGFHAKTGEDPAGLWKMTSALLALPTPRVRPSLTRAPVWIPRDLHDSEGAPFVVITCTDCLRSFPISLKQVNIRSMQETECLFCTTKLQYVLDFPEDGLSSDRPSTRSAAVANQNTRLGSDLLSQKKASG